MHSLTHPSCIALILYPNIILHIPFCIAYASLMHSFDFIPKHHLMHSLTHSLCIPYAYLWFYTPASSYAFPYTSSYAFPYASLMHSFDFVATHHLTHSLTHRLRIALILYPNIILRLPLCITYAPLCIALILYPSIILRIPFCIAYASLMHSFDFIPKHHLMHSLTHSFDFICKHHLTHSLTHSLCIPYA